MKKIFIAAAAGAICALFSGCGIIKHFVGAAAEKNTPWVRLNITPEILTRWR